MSGERVLVVDDEPQIRRALRTGLVGHGYEVETAYHIPLNGLFLVGETPVMNWLQPVVRVSFIDNRFDKPREYPAAICTSAQTAG